MKTLLWKDFRHNRTTLLVGAGIVLMPYMMATIAGLTEHLEFGSVRELAWPMYLQNASLWSLALGAMFCAFLAGGAFASERVDRSAEFAGYLPVPRASAVASKAVLAIAAGTIICAANVVVHLVTTRRLGYTVPSHRWDVVAVLILTALLVFGVSWLFSSLLRSPAIAAASGMASAFVVFFTATILQESLGMSRDFFFLSYVLLCAIIGFGAFGGGVVCALRRVEP